MTYEKIKQAYPLGCSVILNETMEATDGFPSTCEGKILAILDPSKHGPKCLLFKIEKPEGRRISREKAKQTIKRKEDAILTADNKVCASMVHHIAMRDGVNISEWDFRLRWLHPSDIKERVDLEKGAAEGLRRLTESQKEIDPEIQEHINENWLDLVSESNKPKDSMYRTEHLKRILKPGMKVKLRKEFEGWKSGDIPWPGQVDKLGEWVTVWYVRPDKESFKTKGDDSNCWEFPLNMIEKVEREEGPDNNQGEKWPCVSLTESPDGSKHLIHELHHEDLKETLRTLDISHEDDALLRAVLGEETLEALLQEIEEEEKYVKNLRGGETRDEDNGELVFTSMGDHLLVESIYEPEIHEQDGKYIVKFKKEK